MAEVEAKPKIRVRTRCFMTNPLLCRKQFAVEMEHPGIGTVMKKQLRAKLAQMFKVKDKDTIVVYGFKTAYGGGRSTGFGLIYDTVALCKRYEPTYRLVRMGLKKKRSPARKQKKEKKNRAKKARGMKKVKILRGSVAKKK
eukprot:NODE_1923_length_709_cov_352.912121_g1476_i1.p1 GENE.NODE_1923_length_709_cov_352.912121_g1476_i1~~NODE_1923_length_709_cov_352.912121_g1476_i1.p1  ORF type:complete len:159 (-),score=61.23 NODE_1923_length_709_cov_352.912121_g1476_i1:231-653(-)